MQKGDERQYAGMPAGLSVDAQNPPLYTYHGQDLCWSLAQLP
ncbi:hypothetical protein [Klebsiella sp. 2680]|nr:hypothetical protein [Klebsiella sp. 2680]